MTRLRIDKPLRAKLLDQIAAAGIAPVAADGTSPLEIDADDRGGWLTVPDAQLATAQAVVAAFDAAALDAAAQQDRTARQQVRAVIVGYPDLAAPTNAQTVAAVKALCKAVAALYRAD